MEETRQRIKAKRGKLNKYKSRRNQYQKNQKQQRVVS